MTKASFLLLLLFNTTLLPGQTLLKTAENYYRSNPFNKEFSQFLSHMLNDPTLENKKITRRTDSLLFFLEGDYRTHRPFFFPARRCHVILAEVQDYNDDSTNSVFTYYVYQVIGYASPGENGRKDVEEEYGKMLKRNRRGFDSLATREIRNGDAVNGYVTDLYYQNIRLAPLTLAWANGGADKESIFAITIRFLLNENRAYFPVYQNRLMQERP